MSKVSTYNTNAENHDKMLQETKQRIELAKSNNCTNSLHFKKLTNESNLSERFLIIFTEVINENLGFLIFQALKMSERKLNLDREEAVKEAENFISSHKTKHE